MMTKRARKLLLAVGVAAIVIIAVNLVSSPGNLAGAGNAMSLEVPPFVGVVRADALSAASKIEDEAGISAWFQASSTIDLADVRDEFRTIEAETADYIIGSVPVEGYGESHDLHVYIHKNGWLLAYYLRDDPVGKILDWKAYHSGGRANITTKLENTLSTLAGKAGVAFSSATHYDFRYPNATDLMLIVEWDVFGRTDSYEVELPGDFDYYERGWSAYRARFDLDGGNIAVTCVPSQGTLSASQLSTDQTHVIEITSRDNTYGCDYDYGYGSLVLVYRVP